MTYRPELTRAVRRSLYRLRWKLGRAWGERVVLVGGLLSPGTKGYGTVLRHQDAVH